MTSPEAVDLTCRTNPRNKHEVCNLVGCNATSPHCVYCLCDLTPSQVVALKEKSA